MAPGVPSPQRMKIPLLTVLSAQKSALSSKLPYGLAVTRNPVPFVAVIVPSSTFQSDSPFGENPESVRPSNRRVHPAFDSAGLNVLVDACWAVNGGVQKRSISNGSIKRNNRGMSFLL